MDGNIYAVRNRASWLGYLGLLPLIIGCVVLSAAPHQSGQITEVMQAYAAIILTFVGAIHWGRALDLKDTWLMTVSVIPSLLAWFSLLLSPQWGLPVLMVAFLSMNIFDLGQYFGMRWFRRLRSTLTLALCGLLLFSWIVIL